MEYIVDKFLPFFIKLICVILFFLIVCCSHKNSYKHSDKNSEVLTFSKNVSNINSNTLTNTSQTNIDSYNNQPIENFNGIFVSKYLKVLNRNFHYSAKVPKNISTFPVDNVFLVDTVPKYSTSFEFYKKFFSNFEVIGYSIFIYNKSFKLKYIERVAKAKGANLVILKKIHNKEKENYIYDILYLRGKLYSQYYYWMRQSSEAVPVNITLESIKNSKNALNKNYLTSNLKINNSGSFNSEPSIQYKENTLLQPLNENIDSFFQLMEKSEENNNENLNNKPIDTLDEGYKALETRVGNVVGLWMDSYDKTVVRIQEISSDTIKRYDSKAVDNSKIKYYGAYIEFSDEDSMNKYNYYRKVNNDQKLLWHNNDLKFQFNSNGDNGVFLNYNKMPVPALIKVFPAKGVLIVNLPNGEVRYYIPIDFTNIKPEILKTLYSKLPPFVPGKETSMGSSISYTGYGLYGWIIFSGLVLLGLGVISFF